LVIALEIEKEKANLLGGKGKNNITSVVSRQTSGDDMINTSTDDAALTEVKEMSVCQSSSNSSSSSSSSPSLVPSVVENYGLHEIPSSSTSVVMPLLEQHSPWQKINAETVTSP